MKITIRETGKKALIEEQSLSDNSLVYNVIVKNELVNNHTIRLGATDLDHAVKIFDAIESSI